MTDRDYINLLEKENLELKEENKKLKEDNRNLDLHVKNTYDTGQELLAEKEKEIIDLRLVNKYLQEEYDKLEERVLWFCTRGLNHLIHGGVVNKYSPFEFIISYFVGGRKFNSKEIIDFKKNRNKKNRKKHFNKE